MADKTANTYPPSAPATAWPDMPSRPRAPAMGVVPQNWALMASSATTMAAAPASTKPVVRKKGRKVDDDGRDAKRDQEADGHHNPI